jgi:hypothetical protein
MKLIFLSLVAMLVAWATPICAQEDLDAIFDDGDNTNGFGIAVGSDLVTLGTGTLNVFGEFTILDRGSVVAGLGTMPFGVIMDFMNPDIIGNPEDNNLFINGITKPLYYNFALKYIETRALIPFYVYGEIKKWNWISSNFAHVGGKYKRSKFNFGMGYSLHPFDNMVVEAHTGIFLGQLRFFAVDDETDPNFDPFGMGNSYDVFIGFDLGLNLKYEF